jgi:hypothetical protein
MTAKGFGDTPAPNTLQQTRINREALRILETADSEQDAIHQARQSGFFPNEVEAEVQRRINAERSYWLTRPEQGTGGTGDPALDEIMARAGVGGAEASRGRQRLFGPEEVRDIGDELTLPPPMEEDARESITQDQKDYLMEVRGLSEEEINARYRVR